MPRNGSGTYSLPAGNPVVTGTTVSSTAQNTTMSDIATAITQSLAADGQTVPTANLPMASFKLTGLGSGSSLTDSANFGQTINAPAAITLASASTVNIGAALSSNITISGTTPITAFDTVADGITRNVTFSGVLLLTHNATSLILPGASNITTAPGDAYTFLSLGSGNWRCTKYVPAAGIFGGRSSVSNLTGSQNGTTPLTKFDIAADTVMLRNSAGGIVTRYATGTLTCDLGLTGPAANGRDQSAAFTASSWVHLYFIWNGTTLAALASATAPASFDGSTLPSGYRHWSYATTIRWNGSSNIVACYARGSSVTLQAEVSAVSGGSATTETAISLSSVTPPNALSAAIRARLINSNVSGSASLQLRIASGINWALISAGQATTGTVGTIANSTFDVPNVSQQMYYLNSTTSCSSDLSVYGYIIPNGGE